MVLHNVTNFKSHIEAIDRTLCESGLAIISIPHPFVWIKRFARIDATLETKYDLPFQLSGQPAHISKITYHHRHVNTYLDLFSRIGWTKLEVIAPALSNKESDLLFFVYKKSK